MTDILIRISNSVQCCGECPCFYAEHPMHCQADSRKPKRTHGAPYAGKPDWCPLCELPEHGDLIDRSKIEFSCASTTPEALDYARRYAIDRMPVIVPSNKEDTP